MKAILTSHFISLPPPDMSKNSRNLCVNGAGPFEHETPFYLEPSSARMRTLGYLKCILVRSDLKAAAVEGQPLVLFDNFIGEYFWKNGFRHQSFICELVWRGVGHP